MRWLRKLFNRDKPAQIIHINLKIDGPLKVEIHGLKIETADIEGATRIHTEEGRRTADNVPREVKGEEIISPEFFKGLSMPEVNFGKEEGEGK
jgi:hypothetical protein